ncbi:hypothetical protein [Nocardia sp. IFM 10818]
MKRIHVELLDGGTAEFEDSDVVLDKSEGTLNVFAPGGDFCVFNWDHVAYYVVFTLNEDA